MKRIISMPFVKTAISLNRDLFMKANKLSAEMKVSRSKLFQFAIESYIRQYDNKKILNKLNKIYSGELTKEEKKLQGSMKDYHKKIIKDKW